jgi:biopolymer transport protein ExbB/TolQ
LRVEVEAKVTSIDDVPLSWAKGDVEQRLGVRGGRYTRVNNLLSFIIAVILTVIFYACLIPIQESRFAAMFTQRGLVQYFTVFLTAWSFTILFMKWRKLALQRESLKYNVVPASPDFILSTATVDQVVGQIYATVDDPKHFVLFNRIMIALSNLRNLGRVSDVDDILRSQAEHDEASMETSYSLVQGFVWAIPVLGFIGTVVGLSDAIGSFSGVLSESDKIDQLSLALRGVTAGLATAFETTLVALVAALAIQLVLTFLKKSEEEFLDSSADYCVRHVVGKLRIMPFEQARE